MVDKLERLIGSVQKGDLSRREFIHRAIVLTGSLVAATTLADAIAPATSHANLVDPNDPALITSDIKFSSTDGAVIGEVDPPAQ